MRPLRLGLVLAVLAGGSALDAFLIVSPFAQASSEGNDFTDRLINSSQVRFQEVFTVASFNFVDSVPKVISALAFRRNGASAMFPSTLIQGLTIRLGYTTRDATLTATGLSTTFANNPAGPMTTVFSGSIWVSSSSTTSPRAFDILFPLQSPFTYDPALGNLLLDWTRTVSVSTAAVDTHLSTTDGVAVVFSASAGATTGTRVSEGAVTQFEMTNVPEPSTAVMAGLGLGLVGLVAAHRLKSARSRSAE